METKIDVFSESMLRDFSYDIMLVTKWYEAYFNIMVIYKLWRSVNTIDA